MKANRRVNDFSPSPSSPSPSSPPFHRVFRCTLSSIPQTQSLLNKAKLPLGLLLHPFKDLSVTLVSGSF